MLAPAEQWTLLSRKAPGPGWKEDLADPVEHLIKQINLGDWPTTERQLKQVAKHFNKFLDISTEYPIPGMLMDNVIVTTSYAGAIHELAHVVIEQGGFAELRTPGDRTLPHQIAEIVELRYRNYMVFVTAARQEANHKRERIRRQANQHQPELTYSVDEFCDPPAEDDHEIVVTRRTSRTTRRRSSGNVSRRRSL